MTRRSRSGGGGARASIVVDCRTSQTSELHKSTFTITTSRSVTSVRVNLAGQEVGATRIDDRQDRTRGRFSASIDVSAAAGTLAGHVVVGATAEASAPTPDGRSVDGNPSRRA